VWEGGIDKPPITRVYHRRNKVVQSATTT